MIAPIIDVPAGRDCDLICGRRATVLYVVESAHRICWHCYHRICVECRRPLADSDGPSTDGQPRHLLCALERMREAGRVST